MTTTVIAHVEVIKFDDEGIRIYHLTLTPCDDEVQLEQLLSTSNSEKLLSRLNENIRRNIKNMLVSGNKLQIEKKDTVTWENLENDLPQILRLLFSGGKKFVVKFGQ